MRKSRLPTIAAVIASLVASSVAPLPASAAAAPSAVRQPPPFDRLSRSSAPSKPIQSLPPTPFVPRDPVPLARHNLGPMQDAVLPIDPANGGHFIGSDQRFEITVPAAAVTVSDVTAAGGRLALNLRQIAPASGSSAGGSGHVSLGTFLIQVVDATGRLVGHGLRKPVTVTFHFSPQERALGVANGFVLVNGSSPAGINFNPDASGSPMTAAAAGLATSSSVPIVRGNDSGSATITLSPSTTAGFNSSSPVAVFGKPDPFNVDLNAGSLTAGLPLDIPRGPGGLTPPLTLGYSSAAVAEQHSPQGAASWVGEGWSLTPGSITWAERNANSSSSPAKWQDTWQLTDPYGSGVELIPPNVNVSTYYEDANGTAVTASPISWHTAPESYAKVVSYAPPVSSDTPGAVSWGPGRIDAFIRGTDNNLYQRTSTNGSWGSWQLVPGATMNSAPAVTSWGVNRLDVFGRGMDNALYHNWSTNGTTWNSWVRIPATMGSGPTAVSWGSNRFDVFAAGMDHAVYHLYSTDGGATWSTWQSLGGSITSTPTVTSWGANRLDVFARGQDNALYQSTSTDGTTFSSWQKLDGTLSSDPAAVSWGSNRIDVFARGQDLAMYQKTYDTSGWHAWSTSLGGSLATAPAASSWGSGHLDVFSVGQDGGLYQMTYDNAQWSAWQLLTRGRPTGMVALGPCFRVFLPNGIMEEFGCTPDSFQFYPEPTGHLDYVSAWLLDLITDPRGNQIHYTYQRDLQIGAGGYQYPRDAQLATIEWGAPACQSGTLCPSTQWAPLMRVNFAASHAVAYASGSSCPANGTLRCDDPVDLSGSGGLVNPTIQSTFVLNDITVQVRGTGSGPWNTLRDYRLSYDQTAPTQIVDPVTGKNESVAGRLLLAQLLEIGDDGATSLPARTFTYTSVPEYYQDDQFHPNPSTNCGPAWNTGTGSGCLLWSQSYDGNSYYLTSASNGLGLQQTFSWANARNNTHGVNAGGSNLDPLYCNSHLTGYPCSQADDQSWSHMALTQQTGSVGWISQAGQGGGQTTTTVAGTTSYAYQLTPLVTRACADCTVGFTWGNRNDNDYLDYYNGKYMGFLWATVLHPDNAKDLHKYGTTEGWGVYDTGQITFCPAPGTCQNAPWWDLMNVGHGREVELDAYGTDGTTLLKQTTTTYQTVCPPTGVQGSPPLSGYGNWDHMLVSELDHGNPVAVCDVQTAQIDHVTLDGASFSSTLPHDSIAFVYDGSGRVTKETDTANDGAATGSATIIVKQPAYVWNDAVIETPIAATGTYLINLPSFTDVEDGNGIRFSCTYSSYDGQANVNNQSAGLVRGELTRVDRYTSCGTLAGPISTTYGYDGFGNAQTTTDADANAGDTHHLGCPIGGNTFSSCTAYDSTFNSLVTSQTNALLQANSIAYQPPGSQTADGGFGLWPMSTTDPNNQTTATAYDHLGRTTSVTLPGEGTGLTTRTTSYTVWCSATGAQTPCVEVDQTQRLDTQNTIKSRSFYDGWGRLVETRTAAPGNQDVVRYFYYDKSGRLAIQSIAYFAAAYIGSPGALAFSLPDSTQPYTANTYDGLSRLTVTQDPLSNQTRNAISVACNAAGTDSACYEQTLTIDPLGHQQGAMVDAFGRQIYAQRFTGNGPTYPVYATAKYTYDPTGNLTKIVHPDPSKSTSFQYDSAGRKTQQTDPDSGVTTYAYDQDGNLTQSIDARGSTGTVYAAYDGLDRMTWRSASSSGSAPFATFAYDDTTANNQGIHNQGKGRLTSETFNGGPNYSLTGGYTHFYDARGQETSRMLMVAGGPSSPYVVGTTYDDAGNVLTQGYPTGETVTTVYTPQGWLSSLSTTQGNTGLLSGAAYTQGTNQYGGPTGQITAASLGGSTYQYNATYDALGRATDLKWTNGSNTRFEQTRSFDPAGNVTTANTTMPAGTDNQAFCYDEQNRLTWAGSTGTPPCQSLTPGTLTPAYTQTFAYDNLGRISNTTGTGGYSGPTGSYTYGDSAHLHAATAINGTSWSAAYDAAGNMCARALGSGSACTATKSGAQLSVDAEGRLSAWQNAPNPTTSDGFLYDNQGNRVEQQVTQGGTTTTTVYVGSLEQISKIGSAQPTPTTYYYAGAARVALAVNGVFSYLAGDGLGSADVALNATGGVTASVLYAPYGGTRYSSGTMSTDYGFTGQHSDSVSGLDYYNARYYDPLAGQFTSADSVLSGDGYDILGLSRYAYVEGNPIGRTDPSGQTTKSPSLCEGPCDTPAGTQSTQSAASSVSSGPSGACMSLNCSVGDFQNMSVSQRQAFLSTFQSYWGSRYNFQDWFDNIGGVLRFLNESRLMGLNSWFGLVDATILNSISDGLALSLHRISNSQLASASVWATFFSYRLSLRGKKETDQTVGQSNRLWGGAELAATTEGQGIADEKLSPTRAEQWFTEEGDVFYRGPLASWGGPWDPRNGQQANALVQVAWELANVLARGNEGLAGDRLGSLP